MMREGVKKQPLAEAWRDFLRNKEYPVMADELTLSEANDECDDLFDEFCRETGRDAEKTYGIMFGNARIVETKDTFFFQLKENGINVV